MTISARIVTVSVYKGNIVHLVLDPRGSFLITLATRLPLVGQRITGNAGHCIVEGGGGERITYERQGSFLREQVE